MFAYRNSENRLYSVRHLHFRIKGRKWDILGGEGGSYVDRFRLSSLLVANWIGRFVGVLTPSFWLLMNTIVLEATRLWCYGQNYSVSKLTVVYIRSFVFTSDRMAVLSITGWNMCSFFRKKKGKCLWYCWWYLQNSLIDWNLYFAYSLLHMLILHVKRTEEYQVRNYI